MVELKISFRDVPTMKRVPDTMPVVYGDCLHFQLSGISAKEPGLIYSLNGFRFEMTKLRQGAPSLGRPTPDW